MLDDLDRKILKILQGNARISNAEIARRTGKAPSVIFERLRRLEESVIEAYQVRLNRAEIGLETLAYVIIHTNDGEEARALGERLAALENVVEVQYVSGVDGYIIKVYVPDTETLGHLIQDEIKRLPAVRSTRTLVVLKTIKSNGPVPLNGHDREDVSSDSAIRPKAILGAGGAEEDDGYEFRVEAAPPEV